MEPTYFNVSIWVQVHQGRNTNGSLWPFFKFYSSLWKHSLRTTSMVVDPSKFIVLNGSNDVCVHNHDERIDNSPMKGSISFPKNSYSKEKKRKVKPRLGNLTCEFEPIDSTLLKTFILGVKCCVFTWLLLGPWLQVSYCSFQLCS